MPDNYMFLLNSLLFGVGLAVDSFLVAIANGVIHKSVKLKTVCIAGLYSLFQLLFSLVGWAVAATAFSVMPWIEPVFSWLAVAVLATLGIKNIVECLAHKQADDKPVERGWGAIIASAAATSVDALSVGFTTEEYAFASALACSAIIAAVTFAAYIVGGAVGKKFGMRFEKASSIVGGVVFLAIAVEIILTTYLC